MSAMAHTVSYEAERRKRMMLSPCFSSFFSCHESGIARVSRLV